MNLSRFSLHFGRKTLCQKGPFFVQTPTKDMSRKLASISPMPYFLEIMHSYANINVDLILHASVRRWCKYIIHRRELLTIEKHKKLCDLLDRREAVFDASRVEVVLQSVGFCRILQKLLELTKNTFAQIATEQICKPFSSLLVSFQRKMH